MIGTIKVDLTNPNNRIYSSALDGIGVEFSATSCKLADNDGFIYWQLPDSNPLYIIKSVSFEGYINSVNTSHCWNILYTTSTGTLSESSFKTGGSWNRIALIANDKNKSFHEITPNIIIPEGTKAIGILRGASDGGSLTNTFVKSITYTVEFNDDVLKLSDLQIDGETIEGFLEDKKIYAVQIPKVNPAYTIYPITKYALYSSNNRRGVKIENISCEKAEGLDNIYNATFTIRTENYGIPTEYQILILDSRLQWRKEAHEENIDISLFRISSNSEYLDMMFTCPNDYYFTSFLLEVKTPNGKNIESRWFELGNSLFVNSEDRKDWKLRLPLKHLGISPNSMFVLTLKASYLYSLVNGMGMKFPYISENYIPKRFNGLYYIYDSTTDTFVLDKNGEKIPCIIYGQCESIGKEISETAVCSNVNGVYRCILDELLSSDPCKEISENVIRNYLILYGHQAAMSAKDLYTAEMYFKLLQKCFGCAGLPIIKSCNCTK